MNRDQIELLRKGNADLVYQHLDELCDLALKGLLYVDGRMTLDEIEKALDEIGDFYDEYQGMGIRRAFEKLRAKRGISPSGAKE